MDTKTIVETKSIELNLENGYTLTSGEKIPAITVAYESYGELNEAADNAIFICHALTGDAHAAFYHDGDEKPGWWDPLIGPGKAMDTDRYYIVCANILSGCKGTTGPASINPETGTAYATDFPLVSIKDVVNIQRLLLEQLTVKKLKTVIGGSLGGMQALEWACSHSDYIESCICIAAGVSISPQALAFDVIARQEIEHDPDWSNGNYYDGSSKPDKGLSHARQIGHITYQSSASMELKFGRDQRDAETGVERSKFNTDFQVESYLNHQGNKFVNRFDANSYLYITRMMDMFDLEDEYGSIENAFENSDCKFLLVSISSDWLFPPEQQVDIVKALINTRKSVSYFNIDSDAGHDAFLLEHQIISKGVAAFISDADKDIASSQRQDLDNISKLLTKDQWVLDVGSGNGEFMYALQNKKHIDGICVDNDFEMVVACMNKGLNALHMDADVCLNSFRDNSFDCVLMNQTIQQLQSTLQTLKQLLRLAPEGIISFPNFALYKYRFQLFFSGTLPVSDSLPYEWYDTPNIHVITIKDFLSLCRTNHIDIKEIKYLADSSLANCLISIGLKNIGAERAVVKIGR
ncbi:MAG: homoserine O-acetyltransferase [Lentisphaeria bacterium]|nr:homoserine O-acetyltransferase [Lentisphaeria bacterium]NQZ71020.1 homoserine O-acetyltransferase [Lentisphaeria bacterium]